MAKHMVGPTYGSLSKQIATKQRVFIKTFLNIKIVPCRNFRQHYLVTFLVLAKI